MKKYNLDGFMDWGRVLNEMHELRELGLLDQHQDGLKRVLRYKQNWRLRECALECVNEVALPHDDLVAEVCSIICDEDSYPELRMRAVVVVRDLIRKRVLEDGTVPSFEGTSVPDRIQKLLDIPMNPLLTQTLTEILDEIEQMVEEAQGLDILHEAGTGMK